MARVYLLYDTIEARLSPMQAEDWQAHMTASPEHAEREAASDAYEAAAARCKAAQAACDAAALAWCKANGIEAGKA